MHKLMHCFNGKRIWKSLILFALPFLGYWGTKHVIPVPNRYGCTFGCDLDMMHLAHHSGDFEYLGYLGISPLMHYSFSWLRFFSFQNSTFVWVGLAVVLHALCYPLLCQIERCSIWRWPEFLFWLLIGYQFPLYFMMFKGNNDVVVNVYFLFFVMLLVKGRWQLGGFASVTAVVVKLYPLVSVGIAGLGLLRAAYEDIRFRVAAKQLTQGAIVGIALLAVLMGRDYWHYWTVVMPEYIQVLSSRPSGMSHSILEYNQILPAFGYLLASSVLIIWALVSIKLMRVDIPLILLGGFAISTHFQRTAFDYGLVTTYPFFFILFHRTRTFPQFLFLLIGLLSVMSDRHFLYIVPRELGLIDPIYESIHVLVFIFWFSLFGLLALSRNWFVSPRLFSRQ